MSNKLYDILKWLAAPGLPAVATLLIALSQILNIEALAIAGACVAAVAACFGEWTGQSSKKYFADKDIVPKEQNNGN